eukprot:6040802-Karenia_brevis.AAC.1
MWEVTVFKQFLGEHVGSASESGLQLQPGNPRLEVNVFKQFLGEHLGVPKQVDFNFNLEIQGWRLMFSNSFWVSIWECLRNWTSTSIWKSIVFKHVLGEHSGVLQKLDLNFNLEIQCW